MNYITTHQKPPLSFPTVSGSIVTFNSQYAGLPLKSHVVDIDSVSGVSAINIRATGLNLWGGSGMLHTFINANIGDLTYDTTTLTFGAPSVGGKTILKAKFKENTQYTLILTGFNNNSLNTNLRFVYTDGTLSSQFNFTQSNVKGTLVVTSASGKTLSEIRGANFGYSTTLYYNECCLLEGVKTVDDFVSFIGLYTTIQIGSTVNEATYNARTGVLEVTQPSVQTLQLPPCPIDTLEGVNNIFADTGDTTLQYIKLG